MFHEVSTEVGVPTMISAGRLGLPFLHCCGIPPTSGLDILVTISILGNRLKINSLHIFVDLIETD